MAEKSPHIQLKVKISGPGSSSDARRSFMVLARLMTLLSQMETGAIGHSTSTWGIEELTLGSVVTTLTPNRLSEDASSDLMADLAAWTIEGFSEAEQREVLPDHWSPAAIDTGVELSKALGMLDTDGLSLELLANGSPQRSVLVTRRTAENLNKALQRRRTSIGSLIGQLDSISLHNRMNAGLWTERGGQRVEVLFGQDLRDAVHSALGKRVEVGGTLTRDAQDRPVSLRLRHIELLPEQDADLEAIVGADPELTGKATPEAHLRRLYDAS